MNRTEQTPSYTMPTIAGLVPVTEIMTRDVVCVRSNLPINEVIDTIVNHHIGCLPVVDEYGWPIGMITKLDLVTPLANRVETSNGAPKWCDLAPQTAEEAMLPLALTLGHHATVAQAAALMAGEGLHHLPVVSQSGRLIGVLSTLDIVRWLARNDGMLGATPTE